MTLWLVQYRYEKERTLDERLEPGLRERWRISPYKPERITREAQEDDLVVIWRAIDKVAPEHRPRHRGGIVGWGRLRLSGRNDTSSMIEFEVTHAFPCDPIPRDTVLAALAPDSSSGAQWPGVVSLRRLEGMEEEAIRSFLPAVKQIDTSWHPLKSGYPPDWASGWGQDEYGVFIEFTVGDITQRLRWCPRGQFRMGSRGDEAERTDAEGPQVPVTFAEGFWLFETTVTRALFREVMGETSASTDDDSHPVTDVSWDDAQAFLSRLNERIPGLHLRLPAEAEWEYACRAGSETPFEPTVARQFSGNSVTPDEVNYEGNNPYGDTPKGLYREKTVRAKGHGFRPNKWGLWHMHGNVWEWCADVWKFSHEGAAADGSARQVSQQDSGSYRVLRGGSLGNGARRCRSAVRYRDGPGYRVDSAGFRPARGHQGAQAGAAEPPPGSPG